MWRDVYPLVNIMYTSLLCAPHRLVAPFVLPPWPFRIIFLPAPPPRLSFNIHLHILSALKTHLFHHYVFFISTHSICLDYRKSVHSLLPLPCPAPRQSERDGSEAPFVKPSQHIVPSSIIYISHIYNMLLIDIDECLEQSASCLPNQGCVNSPGGYSCVHQCPSGFTKAPAKNESPGCIGESSEVNCDECMID